MVKAKGAVVENSMETVMVLSAGGQGGSKGEGANTQVLHRIVQLPILELENV